MTRASIPTQLCLDRWARILGINPIHFSGAVGSLIWPDNGACADVWPQYGWQTSEELVGREDVAMAVASVEEDFKNEIGYSVAPTWETDEDQKWPYNDLKQHVVQTNYGMLIAPGRRAVILIDADAAVVYSDPDADGWDELATITVSTELTDIREIKVYTAGEDGEPEWEIRPLKSITIAGGVATITLDAWLLINPDLWERFPTNEGYPALDVTDDDIYVDVVDVYREYNDTSQAGITFYTGSAGNGICGCGGVGCQVCAVETQGGCFQIYNNRTGVIVPYPADYSEGAWALNRLANCRPPLRVSLSYYAGDRDKRYLTSKSLDPLSHYFAEAIVWASVARLPKDFCSCNNIRQKVMRWQTDASRFREGAANAELYTHFDKEDVFSCPFGTRVGEVMAWKRVARLVGAIGQGAVL